MNHSEISNPITMFLRTTENCNAGCFMCDYAHLNGQPFIKENEIENIINEAKKSGIQLIRFTGGEPLLDRHMSEYIKLIHDHGIKTSTITNGYLLPRRAPSLVDAGLDQVIVSLDASNADLHDKLRDLKGLFNNATQGLQNIKILNDKVITRVNTVVSPHNIKDLENILNLLIEEKVDQWSIIPIKGPNNLWKNQNMEEIFAEYAEFQKKVSKVTNPRLLGYSKQWAGRDENETTKYFTTGIPYTPRKVCDLVHLVRFYVPTEDKLMACNCVPWRLADVESIPETGLSGLSNNMLIPLITYLHDSGPEICKGCEPINAYLGENPESLQEDIFSF